MPLQAAAGVHDDVCRHLLEHRCNTVPQMREAVSLLVQMQADGVPCRVEADPTQAFVRAEVGTVFLLSSYIRTSSDVLGYLLVQVLPPVASWAMREPLLGHCTSRHRQLLLASRHAFRSS